MHLTHAPTTHPNRDGTISVCCQDAWWCDECGRYDHLAYDIDPLTHARCWPCVLRQEDPERPRLAQVILAPVPSNFGHRPDAN